MKEIRIGKWRIPLPRSRIGRIIVGILLIIGGFFGFLPVLGFWMIPLGLAVLSYDIPAVRRWRRALTVRFGRWLGRRHPDLARRMGLTENGNSSTETGEDGRAQKEERTPALSRQREGEPVP